jgi:lipopolysaccharide heptosyltransferase I
VKILLVRLGALGDLVHTLPVVAALRQHDPALQLDWLVDARHAALLDLVPAIDRRIVISPSGGVRRDRPGHPRDRHFEGKLGVAAAVRALRRERYDVALDLQGLIKSALAARASGAPRVIGFDRAHLREPQAALFHTESFRPEDASHVIRKNLSVLPVLGVQVPARPHFPLEVPLSPALDTIRKALAGEKGDEGHGFVLLNPGAAWPNKQWPAERFGAVAGALRASRGLRSVVVWGPGEEALAARVAAASAGAALVAPPTGVADLVAIAHAARLALSGDTGPLHLAAAVGTPVVAIFGPTDPGRNGPWSADDITLSRFGECVCHYERRCRREHGCIEEITIEDVLGAIERRFTLVPPAHA